MKLSIRHDTTYSYASDVCNSIQFLRLTPRSSERQRITEWQLDLPCKVNGQIDPYGNILHVLTLDKPHGHLALTASGQVEIDPDREQEAGEHSPLPFLRGSHLTQADDTLKAFASRHCGKHRDRAALIGLMQGLAEHMPYSPGATSVGTTAIEAFSGAAGVCQDHTHAFLACARSLDSCIQGEKVGLVGDIAYFTGHVGDCLGAVHEIVHGTGDLPDVLLDEPDLADQMGNLAGAKGCLGNAFLRLGVHVMGRLRD